MQLTTNTPAFIEAEQYSQFILTTLKDGLLPEAFWRNVGDFQSGETLNIKTIGTATLQEASEDTPLVYEPIDTGTVTLQVTEELGDAWYVTDNLREDGAQIDALMAQRAMESTRAFHEQFETTFLETCNSAQVANDPNNVNGFAHRIASSETNNVFALKHLNLMKLAFNKANVPAMGRVFICDPVVESTLNSLVNITTDVTPFAAEIIHKGMAAGQKFIMNLYGFDILTSNRLYQAASLGDGTTTVTNAVANVAMCVLDDQCKPIMGVIRRPPKAEGERNKDRFRDEFVVSSRYGFGPQRVDTLGIIITSAVNF
jgi:hypothetical protein